MPRFIKDITKEIRHTKLNLGLLDRLECTDEENEAFLQMLKDGHPLPPDVYRLENPDGDELDEFYRVDDPHPTEAEMREYLLLQQVKELRTIRKCLKTLTVLGVIAFALALWILIPIIL